MRARIGSALEHAREWPLTPLVIALLALVAGGAAVTELADDVLAGEYHGIDERILLALRTEADPQDPLGPVWFEEAVRDVTALGGIPIVAFAVLAAMGALLLQRKPRAAAYIAVTVASGVALTFWLKHGVNRPRPDLVAHEARVLTKSFPSGHAATSTLAYLTLGGTIATRMAQIRLKVYAIALSFVLAIAIGMSRVYLGVHWPSDVLAGWIIGLSWAFAAASLASMLSRRGKVEPPEKKPTD